MTSWVMLIMAGLFEICWAISLKATNGWTNLPYLAVNVVFGLLAAYSLSQAMRAIPMATAYPIWKGIAILGVVLYEILYERQPLNLARISFALLIVVGIVGLKVVTPATTGAAAPARASAAP